MYKSCVNASWLSKLESQYSQKHFNSKALTLSPMAVSGEKLYLYMMTMTADSQFFLIEGSRCHKLNPQPWNRYFSWNRRFYVKIPLGCLRDTQSLLYGKLQYHNIAEWFQLNQKRTVNVGAKYFLPPKLVFSHHGLALRTTGGGTLKILVTYRLQGRLLRKLLSVIHDVCCYELKALTRPGPVLGVQPDLNQKCISDVYPRRGTSKCT